MRSIKTFERFHMRRFDRIVPLDIEIPRYLYRLGRCLNISYRSDKWNLDRRFENYIHEWENPTVVWITKRMLLDLRGRCPNNQRYDLGDGPRNEVGYLGSAIDFELADGDVYSFEGQDDCFLVASPSEQVLYFVVNGTDEIYCFINPHLRIRPEGITG